MHTDRQNSRRDQIKSKWSKIRKSSGGHDTDGNDHVVFTDDINDFLAGANQDTKSITRMGTRPHVTPRLDISIARRWPEPNEPAQPGRDQLLVTHPTPSRLLGKAKKLGLVVRFVDTPPEVIGCGGDETDVPPIYVSRDRRLVTRPRQRPGGREPVVDRRDPSYHVSLAQPRSDDDLGTASDRVHAISSLTEAGVFADRSRPQRGAPGGCSINLKHDDHYDHNNDETNMNLSRKYDKHDQHALSRPTDKAARHVSPGARGSADTRSASMHGEVRDQPESQDPPRDYLYRTQSRMRAEEGRAFSTAYRLSQILAESSDYFVQEASSVQAMQVSFPELRPLVSSDKAQSTQNSPDFASSETSHSHAALLSRQVSPQPQGLAPAPAAETYNRTRSTSAATSASATSQRATDSPQQASLTDFSGRLEESSSGDPESKDWKTHARPDLAQKPVKTKLVTRKAVPGSIPRSLIIEDCNVPKPLPQIYTAYSRAQSPEDSDPRRASTGLESEDSSSALQAFAARVWQMSGVFRLTAQKERPQTECSSDQWLRCAHWWLSRGKREVQQNTTQYQRGLLMQGHVNIAKAWWIATEILGHDEARSPPLPDQQYSRTLLAGLQETSAMLRRQECMPPQASLIQGQDTTIWLEYPQFPPALAASTQCLGPTCSVSDVVSVADTQGYFHLHTLFPSLIIRSGQHGSTPSLPCGLSIVRHRMHYRASIIVATQDGTVMVLIGPEHAKFVTGPTWYDIAWRARSCSMVVKLFDGLVLEVDMSKQDYEILAAAIEDTRTVDKSFQPADSEKLIFSTRLAEAHFASHDDESSFPNNPVKGCFIGVFQRTETEIQEHHKRKVHLGHRLMLITPTTYKVSGVVNKHYNASQPFLYKVVTQQTHTLNLRSGSSRQNWQIRLTFEDESGYARLLDLMKGSPTSPDEEIHVVLPLRALSMHECASESDSSAFDSFSRLQWSKLEIVSSIHHSTAVLNPSLRILMHHDSGTVVDRCNVASGSLFLRLPCSRVPRLTLARSAQSDISQCLSLDSSSPDLEDLSKCTGLISSCSTMRHYTFDTLSDLARFQLAITGHKVVFDSCPLKLSMTRHRSLTSLTKHVEACRVRFQVLVRVSESASQMSRASTSNDETQLAMWFEDFPLAESLIIPIKSSDKIERVKGQHGPGTAVKLVEAKFTLPCSNSSGLHRTGTKASVGSASTATPLSPSASVHSGLSDGTSDSAGHNSSDGGAASGGAPRWTKGVRKISFGKRLTAETMSDGGRVRSAPCSADGRDLDHDQEQHIGSDGLPAFVKRAFVNVEGLEWARESDDVVIHFASEDEASQFCAALPDGLDMMSVSGDGMMGSTAASRLFHRRR